jgi:hypothetical protein
MSWRLKAYSCVTGEESMGNKTEEVLLLEKGGDGSVETDTSEVRASHSTRKLWLPSVSINNFKQSPILHPTTLSKSSPASPPFSTYTYLHHHLPYSPTATMSTLEDLEDLERENKDDKNDGGDKDKKPSSDDAEMRDAAEDKKEEEEDVLDEEILGLSTTDIVSRRRLLENDARIMKSEFQRLTHEKAAMADKIKENLEKIENNRCVNQKHFPRLNPKVGWQTCFISSSANFDYPKDNYRIS